MALIIARCGANVAAIHHFPIEMLPSTLRLARDLLRGNRVALSRAITLVESTNPLHELQAERLLDYVAVNRFEGGATSTEKPFRVGITGPPGAGKSTFIESLGVMLVEQYKKRLAVLAVDPSSVRNHGSILGDKTRMAKLSVMENAYVRPSPTRGFLGGIARHTNDVISLAEAAGFNMVLVETVGLGQSEILVDDAVDMLVLVVPPANGDELQGVKKGIMEVADLVVVNKADGPLADLARQAASDYVHSIQLARRKYDNWRPRVRRCSALQNTDIQGVWEVMERFRREMGPEIEAKRLAQAKKWMWEEFASQLVKAARASEETVAVSGAFETRVAQGSMTPRHAARELIEKFLERRAARGETVSV